MNNSDRTNAALTASRGQPARLPRRIAWTLWALVPVGLLAYHFGPGQAGWREDQAARIVERAASLQEHALALQDVAYEAHLEAIAARVAAFGTNDAVARAAALQAGSREEAAYATASIAWRDTANALAEAETMVEDSGGRIGDEIRLARARALVRSGEVAQGAALLEDLLVDLTNAGNTAPDARPRLATVAHARGADRDTLARATREELATAYYYGARLLRLAGKPADEWREAAARAKQNYRYLAEDAKTRGASRSEVTNHEMNGELVLNLEQSSLEELHAQPRPKDSPTGSCEGLCQGDSKNKGKRPGGTKPSKGAGMNGEIGIGW